MYRNPTGLYPTNVFAEDYDKRISVQSNLGPTNIDWSKCYQQERLGLWRGYTGSKYLGKEQQKFSRKLYNTHISVHPPTYPTYPEIRDYKLYRETNPNVPFNFNQLQDLKKSEIYLENQKDIYKLDSKSKMWRYDGRDHQLI